MSCMLTEQASTSRPVTPHPFATWVRDALEVAYDHVRTAARQKRLYDTEAVNRKCPVGSWVLRYYPPVAQHKLGSPWVGPNQVVRQATGHTVGIQCDQQKPIVFVHVDDLKICPTPAEAKWSPDVSTAKSLCAGTVAFRPVSQVSDVTSTLSVDVSEWGDVASHHSRQTAVGDLDRPIDLDMFYHRSSSETWIIWTADSTK